MENIRSPFKFLDPYTFKDRKIFFGRSQEIEALYKMAYQTDIMLIYGRSGTGKTSLVQCGLGNRFNEADWFDIFVRKGKDINVSLYQALARVAKTPLKKDATIVQMVKSVYLDYFRPVYLLFDQFEELFILGTPEEQERFIDDMDRLIKAELNCKIILIMREEYLARLDKFEKKIPSLFSKRYRVEPMTHSNVGEVILGSCQEFGIPVTEPDIVVTKIIEHVKDEQGEVPLAYLQVYLDHLYKVVKRKGTNPVTFTPGLVDQVGGISGVLGTFLKEQEKELQEELKQKDPKVPRYAVRSLLNQFVSVEGTKQPMNLQEIKVNQLSADQIRFCLEYLENSRIIRSKDETYELVHDTLAKHIANQRDAKEVAMLEVVKLIQDRLAINKKWQNAYSERKLNLGQLRKNLTRFNQMKNFLSSKEILIIEEQRQNLRDSNRLSGEEWSFVDESIQYHKRRRTQRRWLRGSTIGGLSFGLAISLFFGNKARNNEKLANYNLARLYEERATAALADGNRPDAWLYTLEALHLKSAYNLPKSLNRLMDPDLQPKVAYRESGLKFNQSINLIHTTQSKNRLVLCNSKEILVVDPIRDSLVNNLSLYVDHNLLLLAFPNTSFVSRSEIRDLAFDPEDKLALMVFRDDSILRDHPALLSERVYQWNLEDRKRRTPFIPQYHQKISAGASPGRTVKATGIDVSPTGDLFAVSRSDSSVAIYAMDAFDPAGSRPPNVIISCKSPVQDLKFSPDGKSIAMGIDSGQVAFYSLDGTLQYTLREKSDQPIQELQFLPGTDRIAGITFNRGISIWSLGSTGEKEYLQDSILAANQFLMTPRNTLVYGIENAICFQNLINPVEDPFKYFSKGAILTLGYDQNTNRLYYATSNKELHWINLNFQLFDEKESKWYLDNFVTNFGEPWTIRLLDTIYKKSFQALSKKIEQSYLKSEKDSLVYLANYKYYGMELREPRVIDFTGNDVIRYKSSKESSYPIVYRDSIVLTPDGVSNMASAVFIRSTMQPPFTVRFDYLMRNEKGPYPNGKWDEWPADGLVLMLFKDSTAYRKQIPNGNNRGFILDNTGYGLHFATFTENDIQLMDGAGNLLFSIRDAQRSPINPPVYTDGNEWRHIQVLVSKDQITVQYACGRSYTWRGNIDLQFGGLGFAAGTGGATAKHLIRNVQIDPDLLLAYAGNATITGNRVSVRANPVINSANILLKLDVGAQVQVLDSINSKPDNAVIAKQSSVVELDGGGTYSINKGKGMELLQPEAENGQYHIRIMSASGVTTTGRIAATDVETPELKWYKISSPCIGREGYVYAPYVAYNR